MKLTSVIFNLLTTCQMKYYKVESSDMLAEGKGIPPPRRE